MVGGFDITAGLRGRKVPASESGRYKCAQLHACVAKGLDDLGGDLGRAGGVAVDAEGVGVQGDFGAIAGEDFPLHDAYGLLGGFGGILDQGVGVFAGAQGAVGFVAAIGEGFGGDGEAGVAENIEHRRTC
jgi:hypothetical protein